MYNDWYRGTELRDLFQELYQAGFFSRFRQIIFFGGSMGGFGALSLSATVPGSIVIALNPQTTLNPDLVPWEDRFRHNVATDWSEQLADAATTSALAEHVWVCYDPFLKNDVKHVRRLPTRNLTELKLPGVGHSTAAALHSMGLLKSLIIDIAAGNMNVPKFERLARHRREIIPYWVEMSRYLNRHPRWQLHFAQRALEMEPKSEIALAAKLRAAGKLGIRPV